MIGRLKCRGCGKAYPLNTPRWRCDCGSLLDLEWRGFFDPADLPSRKPNLWRYQEALPIEREENIVSFGEGFTPLVEFTEEGRTLLLKQEQLFPSGSYKDRGAAALVSKVKELGVNRVVEDSSGNAGCAIAAYCALAGIACDIYVPESTSPAKLAQIESYGATLHRIPGTREDTARAARVAAETTYYASHVWNSFFFHGTKTFAYEVWEQLGYRAPDTLVIPTGNGTLLIGAMIGFTDLIRYGCIDRLPKLIAVQAANCAPLHRMSQEERVSSSEAGVEKTMAEGIAIAEPARARQMIEMIRETGGEVLTVTEVEIQSAWATLCRNGFYVEPTSAVALAGFRNLATSPGETVVAPLTGHGLKSTDQLMKISNT